MSAARWVGTILAGLAGAALTAVGIGLFLLAADARGGFHTPDPIPLRSPTRALLAAQPDIVGAPPIVAARAREFRVRARSRDDPLFLGVGRRSRVEAFLARVDHELVEAVRVAPPELRTTRVAGARTPPAPAARDVWLATSTGRDVELSWRPRGDDLAVVLMNASGRPEVAAEVEVGARAPLVLGLGIIATMLGLAGLAVAVASSRPGAGEP